MSSTPPRWCSSIGPPWPPPGCSQRSPSSAISSPFSRLIAHPFARASFPLGQATGLGDISGVIHAAGVSPSQASPASILEVDLYGTALVLEEFGNTIASGGAGVVIASQSGHRLGALTTEQDVALATTPTDELLTLPMLQPAAQLPHVPAALRQVIEEV